MRSVLRTDLEIDWGFMMAETGAGAWIRPGGYRLQSPVLGSGNQARINAAVRAIQSALKHNGYDPGLIDGLFGPRTSTATVAFQKVRGYTALGPADGIVGPRTAKQLFLRDIRLEQMKHGIPSDYLAGLVRTESAYDPGAQGYLSPADFGLVQINTGVHQISMAQAIDPSICLPWAAQRMRAAFDKFQHWDLAIAFHNSPLQAQKWYNNKFPPSEQIWNYVIKVKLGA